MIITPLSIAILGYNLTVGTNQSQYYTTEQVSISGRLTENGSGIQGPICLEILNPSSSTVFSGCFQTDSQGHYSKFYSLDSSAQLGTYTINVEYHEGDVLLASASTSFEVVSSTVMADAGETYYGIVNQPVQFNGDVSGGKTPYNWYWDFGDGNSDNSNYPSNNYDVKGNYSVSLSVVDSGGHNGQDATLAIIEDEMIVDSNGPYFGSPNASINFYGTADGGYPPYTWNWDFGEGSSSDEQNPTHNYNTLGTYTINLTVTDEKDYQSYDSTTILISNENHPPNKPSKPSGLTNGKSGVEYIYSSSTTDPDGDQVYYLWDWGDETVGEWLGPYDSGDEETSSHVWGEEGNYEIKVKTKDINGEESDWSDPLPISMPKNKLNINSVIQEFLKQHPHLFPILKLLLKL